MAWPFPALVLKTDDEKSAIIGIERGVLRSLQRRVPHTKPAHVSFLCLISIFGAEELSRPSVPSLRLAVQIRFS